MYFSLLASVIKRDVETTGHGDDELVQRAVGMTGTGRAAGHVVQVIHALNRKGDLVTILDEGQISPWIRNFWQIDEAAEID